MDLNSLKVKNNLEIAIAEAKLKKLCNEITGNDFNRLENLKKENEYILDNIGSLDIDFLGILEFLERFHLEIPFNHRIEIRCLPVKECDKFKSVDLYGYDIANQFKLLKLFKSINLKEYNIYYSIYKYELTDIKRRRINKANSRYISLLAWDFDKISKEEMEKKYKFCTSRKVFPMVVNSGFGYHFIFRLDGNYFDTNLLEYFNKLGQDLGLGVDPAVKDSARILRLPYTYNCKKVLENGVVNHNKAIPCLVVERCGSILSAGDLFKVFGGEYCGARVEAEVLEKGESDNFLVILKNSVKARYAGCLKDIDLPTNILNMLNSGAAEGYRNESLMYLVFFFKNYLKYNKLELKKIVTNWNQYCRPSYNSTELEKTFERLYKNNYGCSYSKTLENIYGKRDKKSYATIKEAVKKVSTRNIIIPNKLFLKAEKLKPTSVKVFLNFLIGSENFKVKDKYFTYILKDKLIDLCGISKRTLIISLKELKENQLLSCMAVPADLLKELKEIGHKVNGNTEIVCLDKSVLVNDLNYTNIEKDILQMALNELDSTNLTIFIYLVSQLKRLGNDFNLSQFTVGKRLNMSQSTVSRGCKKLIELGYIKQGEIDGRKYYLDTSLRKFMKEKEVPKKEKDENVFFKIADESLVNTLVLNFD